MPESALLVLDLQRDFLEPAGRMPIAEAQVAPLLSVANQMIDAAAAGGVPVVYVVNAFPRSQRVLNFLRHGAAVVGTPGADMDPRVALAPGARTFAKERSDAFTNAELDACLRQAGVKHLAVMGVFAPHCVRSTVQGALARKYRVTVVKDGVGAASDGARARALVKMAKDGGVVAEARRVVLR